MGFLLHQSIIHKIFMVDALLNIGHLLEPKRLVYIIFFHLWKKAIVLINWSIKDT
jgi:hypothetical protein